MRHQAESDSQSESESEFVYECESDFKSDWKSACTNVNQIRRRQHVWRITPAEPTPSHTHTHRERDIAHTMNGFVYEIRIMQSIEFYLPPQHLHSFSFHFYGLHVASCKTTITTTRITNRWPVRAIYYNAQIEIRKYRKGRRCLPEVVAYFQVLPQKWKGSWNRGIGLVCFGCVACTLSQKCQCSQLTVIHHRIAK